MDATGSSSHLKRPSWHLPCKVCKPALGSCNKIPQPGLWRIEAHCITVLEARSPRSRCWQGLAFPEASFLRRQSPSCYILTGSLLCVCIPRVSLFLQRHQSGWIRVIKMTSVNLITSLNIFKGSVSSHILRNGS
jgi:hypothetical protein